MIDLNPVPNRLTRPDTLDDDVDSFMGKLPQWGSDLIALASSVGSSSSANRVPFQFSTSTAIADPGAGFLRLNSAAQNAATALALDVIGSDAVDYTALLNTFSASTSASIGQMRLEKSGDASKFLVFNVTAMTSPSGYRQFTAACIGYSSANPFANGDVLLMSYTRTGDKGDVGSVASFPTLYAREEQAAGVATTTVTTLGGWGVCVLNTAKVNEIAGASLSGNQITLPAGTYEFEGSVPAYFSSGATKGQLYNVTDGVQIDAGTVESHNASYSFSMRSVLRGKFTISATKTLSVRRFIAASSAGSFTGLSGAATTEIYAEIKFKKVA